MEKLSFLSEDQARAVRREFGTPVFVYDQRTLEAQADAVLAFPNAYGLSARYAMKALPTTGIIRILHDKGLHIDASSGFEAERALRAGIPPAHIQITAQEIPRNLDELLDRGVLYNACSLHQLEEYGRRRPGTEVSVRINPGLGSGHSNRTNTGGPSASYGVWHEYLGQAVAVAEKHALKLTRMHTHIGSGTDPDMWMHCAELSLGIAAKMPEARALCLGGGFKVGRMAGEQSADLEVIGARIKQLFLEFHERHGRELELEIEPGTFLVANAGALVCSVIDVVDTGPKGYNFIKIDSGMTELARPAMYGAQHPIVVVPASPETRGAREYLVAGHCCESGDIFTPEPGNPEGLEARRLTEARIGDVLVVGGAGAYGAAMSCKNYNSFPEAAEVLLKPDGTFTLLRARQTLDQMLQNEV